MAEKPEIKHALVEWTEGADKGMRSIVRIDCIRNFSLSDFLSVEESDEEYEKLVEWQQGRKPWPVYQARILHVASIYYVSL